MRITIKTKTIQSKHNKRREEYITVYTLRFHFILLRFLLRVLLLFIVVLFTAIFLSLYLYIYIFLSLYLYISISPFRFPLVFVLYPSFSRFRAPPPHFLRLPPSSHPLAQTLTEVDQGLVQRSICVPPSTVRVGEHASVGLLAG